MHKIGFQLTKDRELLKSKDYQKIVNLIKKLYENGTVDRAQGYCYSIADMMKSLLSLEGISSKIIECQLTITCFDPPSMKFYGFDQKIKNNDIDTHVVVITETEIPMIIDISISHLYPTKVTSILERANGIGNQLADLELNGTRWVYQTKTVQRFPQYHQTSILERIQTDKKVQKELKLLKLGLILVVVFASLNFGRGAIDFYQTYFQEGNYWGPDHNKKIIDRIEQLEKSMNNK